MSFICPKCGLDFGTDKKAFHHHFDTCAGKEVLSLLGVKAQREDVKPISKKKAYVNIQTVKEAVEDGRLSLWQDFDGEYHLRNNRSKKEVVIKTDADYFGEDE